MGYPIPFNYAPAAGLVAGQTLPTGLTIPSPTITGTVNATGMTGQLPYVLAQSGTAVTAAVDTNENILGTATIPASAMGTLALVRVTASWTCNNSANVKTIRVRLGGAAGTIYHSGALTSSTGGMQFVWVQNANAANAQVGGGYGFVVGGTSLLGVTKTTSAIDTSASTTLVITAQKATAGDTMTLDNFTVELLRIS
jgi:hypothetical protein